MAHAGVSPLDPLTAVGQLRVNIGDTLSIALVPPVSGQADYANFSDADLEALLALSGDSVYRATGSAYMRLAAEYSALGRSVKTDDLGLDTRGRGSDLLKIAQFWFERADVADQSEADDYFELVAPSFTPISFSVEGQIPEWVDDPEEPGYLMPL